MLYWMNRNFTQEIININIIREVTPLILNMDD